MAIRPFHLLALLFLTGCLGTCAEDACLERPVCLDEGQCGTSFLSAGDSLYRCYVRSSADCEASSACQREGRCVYDPTVSLRCIGPTTPPQLTTVCARSKDCVRWGSCTLVEGTCRPQTAADCEQSIECIAHGDCTLKDDWCVAGTHADCGGSLECLAFARCALQQHPYLGTGNECAIAPHPPPTSCVYDSSRTERCATYGECLAAPDRTCHTPEQHGLSSPRLDEARRRLREAIDPQEPIANR